METFSTTKQIWRLLFCHYQHYSCNLLKESRNSSFVKKNSKILASYLWLTLQRQPLSPHSWLFLCLQSCLWTMCLLFLDFSVLKTICFLLWKIGTQLSLLFLHPPHRYLLFPSFYPLLPPIIQKLFYQNFD